MKKHIKLLSIFTLLSLLGGAVATFISPKGDTLSVDAGSDRNTTGFYVKITDPDDLLTGDKVLITARYLYNDIQVTISTDRFEGNPYYFYGCEADHVSKDFKYIYLNNNNAVEYEVNKVNNSDFYFYGNVGGSTGYQAGFLGYNNNPSYHNRIGIIDEGNNSKFSLSYNSTEGVMYLYSSGYSDAPLTYSDSFGFNPYKTESNINIYKKVHLSDETISLNTSPKITNYYVGDDFYGDGMVITVSTATILGNFNVSYSNAPDFFSFPKMTQAMSESYEASFCGQEFILTNIHVEPNPGYTFTKVTSGTDLRGRYLIVYEESATKGYVFNSLLDDINGYINSYEVSINNNKITCSSSFIYASTVTIEREQVGNNYYNYIKNANGKYLRADSNDNISQSDTKTIEYNAVEFFTANAVIRQDNYFDLRFEKVDVEPLARKFVFYTGDDLAEISLYALDYNSEIDEDVETVFTSIDDNLRDHCDFDGGSSDKAAIQAGWALVRSAYNGVSEDAQGYLARLTYDYESRDTYPTTDPESYVACYDYILHKYGVELSLDDFMLRKGAGTYHEAISIIPGYSILNSGNDLSSIIIVVVVSLASVSVLAFVFFYKRRKQN